jgi:hypothetical protein
LCCRHHFQLHKWEKFLDEVTGISHGL